MERTAGTMHGDIERVILSAEEIRQRTAELGDMISNDYGDEPVLMIAVLRGAALFIADLARAISSPVEIDFMAVSSYGSSTKSSGVVRIIKDLDEGIEGRHVLVVEDILDTGLTLKYLLKNLASRGPTSLEVVTLLSKEGKQRVPISCKYVGFDIADE
ncbi:MAG: hypoxanthine phosphoribosyltransferase, partial [Coriobacteriia bacterium]